jgi:hypothetical protein
MDRVMLEDGVKTIELSNEARRLLVASCEPHPVLKLT